MTVSDPPNTSHAATPSMTAAWCGSATLHYARRDDTTLSVRSDARAPFKLQKALYPEGKGLCHSVLVHTAGGMVGGDELAIGVVLEPGSQSLITTPAANRVYRSSGATTHQTVHITLQPQTCLEWFPQELILFNGARFRQQVRIDLAPDALWVGWDITRFGRTARGETFDQGHWRSSTEVWQEDRPLWLDRQFLQGGSAVLTSPHGLAGYPVIANFALLGKLPSPDQVTAIRQLWVPDQAGEVGVTRLQNGLLCRYRGPSSQTARRWFVAIWQQLRPWYLNRAACVPRVWGL